MIRPVLLGLGSNLGDRLGNLRAALRRIGTAPATFTLRSISAIYESDALLPDDADPSWAHAYLNLAVLGETEAEPTALLSWLKSIEADLGRDKGPRWSPRLIDIDLLAIDGVRLERPELTLPHRELTARPFVLLPVADLAPDWPLPNGDGVVGAGALAGRWRVDPGQVPFRTRRIAATISELVGVVNVTADSFSDGGRWLDSGFAIEQGKHLARGGATVIDIGAESTRPGAEAVGSITEWQRLEPVLKGLRAEWSRGSGPLLSVDTRHPDTARRALAAGADWINDVTGFASPEMVAAVASGSADLVVMHAISVPPIAAATLPVDADPTATLLSWGAERIAALEQAGVARERIILDPGIGFGKTGAQTARILGRIGELRSLGVRILVGHSRKSFLKSWFGHHEGDPCRTADDREIETVALTQELAGQAVDYIRVHDVAANQRALAAAALVRAPLRWTGSRSPSGVL